MDLGNLSVEVSEPLSPPEALEQLAPGVVLAGRYSLKDRVPRWIAERRFRARDAETGKFVAVLLWSAETPWFAELVQKLEESPDPSHLDAGVRQGLGVVILDWGNGARELDADAHSADEALSAIQALRPAKKRSTLPPRKTRNGESVRGSTPREMRETVEPLPEPAPVVRTNPKWEWAAFGLAVVVAAVVIWFTVQLGRALSEPIIIERKISVTSPTPAPTPVTLDTQLQDVAMLRKNGNATSALKRLIELRKEQPNENRISNEINGLLNSLQPDLPAIRAGLRPPLRAAIEQLAAEGNPAAIRLSEQLTAPEAAPTNSSEPLPIR